MKRTLSILLLIMIGSALVRGQQNPKKQLFFAFFANGEVSSGVRSQNLQTEFAVTNVGPQSAELGVQFFRQDGTQIQILGLALPPFQLAAQSSFTISVTPTTPLSLGWVKIDSTQPITALESINRLEIIDSGTDVLPIKNIQASVAVEPSTPTRDLALFVIDDENWGTGISIAVPGASSPSVSGTLTLVDEAGRKIASREVSVGPANQLVQLGSQLFPELTSIGRRSGTIIGQFTGDVIISSLKFGKKATPTPLLSQNLLSSKIVQ